MQIRRQIAPAREVEVLGFGVGGDTHSVRLCVAVRVALGVCGVHSACACLVVITLHMQGDTGRCSVEERCARVESSANGENTKRERETQKGVRGIVVYACVVEKTVCNT